MQYVHKSASTSVDLNGSSADFSSPWLCAFAVYSFCVSRLVCVFLRIAFVPHFQLHIAFCVSQKNHFLFRISQSSFVSFDYLFNWMVCCASDSNRSRNGVSCVSCVCLTQNCGGKEKNCIFWFHIYVLFGDKWMSCSCVYFMADARWNNREFIGFTLIVPTSLQFPSVCLSRWSSVFGVWTVIKVPNKLHVIIAWMSGRLATYA